MPKDKQDQVVETGLLGTQASEPEAEPVTASVKMVELPELDRLVEQELQRDRTVQVSQPTPIPSEVTVDHKTYEEALEDNRKRDFVLAILKARQPSQVQQPTQPVIPAMLEQTRREMEAGAARVAFHAEQEAIRPPRPREDNDTMIPVFRPSDYVPDPKKGEGTVASNTARVL